jgi:hypothetical protein
MTHPQNPISEPETVTGPGAGSARKARRLAVVGAAALLVAAGGATAAYASGSGSESGYATVISSTESSQSGTPIEVEPPAGPGSDQPSGWQDCPEKQGGSGEQGGSATPESEAASPAPDTSTL